MKGLGVQLPLPILNKCLFCSLSQILFNGDSSICNLPPPPLRTLFFCEIWTKDINQQLHFSPFWIVKIVNYGIYYFWSIPNKNCFTKFLKFWSSWYQLRFLPRLKKCIVPLFNNYWIDLGSNESFVQLNCVKWINHYCHLFNKQVF